MKDLPGLAAGRHLLGDLLRAHGLGLGLEDRVGPRDEARPHRLGQVQHPDIDPIIGGILMAASQQADERPPLAAQLGVAQTSNQVTGLDVVEPLHILGADFEESPGHALGLSWRGLAFTAGWAVPYRSTQPEICRQAWVGVRQEGARAFARASAWKVPSAV
jgi:hypothetical protein